MVRLLQATHLYNVIQRRERLQVIVRRGACGKAGPQHNWCGQLVQRPAVSKTGDSYAAYACCTCCPLFRRTARVSARDMALSAPLRSIEAGLQLLRCALLNKACSCSGALS